MPMCQPGRMVPGQGIVTNTLVVEEAWGEIWRAEHERHGQVLFVAYTTPKGDAMFRAALPELEKWKNAGKGVDQRLLHIHQISPDTVIPYLIVEDPTGPTWRELILREEKDHDPGDMVKWTSGLLDALTTTTNLGIAPVGITADTVFYDPNNQMARWRFLPVAPGEGNKEGLLGNQRYTHTAQSTLENLSLSNIDSYSLTWMLVEAIAEDPNLPRNEASLDTVVPLPRLATELRAGTQWQGSGCIHPNTLSTVLKRWQRNDSEKELKEYNKAYGKKKKGKRTGGKSKSEKPKAGGKAKPKKQKAGGNSGAMIGAVLIALLKVVLFLAVFAGTAYGVYYLFVPRTTTKTPVGTARLYFQAVVQKDLTAAKELTTDDATYDTEYLFDVISTIERTNAASKLGSAQPVTEKVGTKEYIGTAHLKGENGDSMMVVTFKVFEQDDGTFKIFYLDWEGTTEKTLGF